MGRWSCRTAARICARRAPRTFCNGVRRSGSAFALRGRRPDFRKPCEVGFPGVARPRQPSMPGHLPVTILRQPTNMWFRRMLTILVVNGLACSAIQLAQAQATPPSPKPSKAAAKPAAAVAKPPPSVTGGAEPTLIGQFGTWGAYTATPNGKKVCFALAKPATSKTNPPNRPRDPAYAFVSTRPAEKVFNEVSVMIGYTVKPGSESTLQVGGASYAMYTQGDGLWIKNAAEEER